MKNFFLTCAALLLAGGMAQAQQIDVNTPKADIGKMLPRVEQMSIESSSVYRAPRKAIGDVIAHWPLNTFQEFSMLMSMALIDANDDGIGWGATSTGTNLNVFCSSSADEANDDWLITPAIYLEAGKNYQVSVQLRGRNVERKMEIMAGQEATAEGMSIRVTGVENVTTDAYHMHKGTFIAPTDGEYMIGFHDVSDAAERAYLYLADIIVSEAAPGGAPAAPTDFTVVPGENAALTADIHFTLPTLTVAGDELTDIDYAELLCNGETVCTWNDVAPGDEIAYVDMPTSGGSKTYVVIAYNDAGQGAPAEQTVWVGYDIPKAPTNVVLSADNPDDMLLTWDAPTAGYNGLLFDPENIWYHVYSVHTTMAGSTLGDVIFTTEKGVTSQQLGQGIDEGEERGMNCFAVAAVNESGEGPFQGSNYLLIGAPYELPFEESFPNGMASTFWTGSGSGLGYEYGLAGSGIRNVDTESGGALFMETFFNDTIQGHSFKVSLKDAKAPKLSFKRSTENGYLIMQVIVYNADRTHVETVYEEDIPEPDGWKEMEVSLDAFVNEPRYICVAFSAIDPMTSNYYKYLNVTDIRIYDAAPTAITEVVSERDVDNTIYSIDGRVMGTSIENLPQGIYIQGGKKILK